MPTAINPDAIYRARIEQGLTQRALGRAVGVTASQISRVENGVQNPGPLLLHRLMKKLGLSWDDVGCRQVPIKKRDGSNDTERRVRKGRSVHLPRPAADSEGNPRPGS